MVVDFTLYDNSYFFFFLLSLYREFIQNINFVVDDNHNGQSKGRRSFNHFGWNVLLPRPLFGLAYFMKWFIWITWTNHLQDLCDLVELFMVFDILVFSHFNSRNVQIVCLTQLILTHFPLKMITLQSILLARLFKLNIHQRFQILACARPFIHSHDTAKWECLYIYNIYKYTRCFSFNLESVSTHVIIWPLLW